MLVNLAPSGYGKTRLIRCAAGVLRDAIGDRMLLRTQSGVGTAEGLWDLLAQIAAEFGMPAATLVVDEFGDELRKMLRWLLLQGEHFASPP